ncbi:MAG: glycosyltransferase family 4 protein [Ignavibacteriales bacterium]|nr:glycosyltransferase family 4 protein [Ignavibacteriales bacterium]
MRIAIDGRVIIGRTTGIGQYAEHLVRSLLKIDQKNHYILFLIEPNEQIQAPNLTKVNIKGYERMVLNRWWENFLLPQHIEEHYADIYFSPAYALPFLPQFGKFVKHLPLPHSVKRLFNVHRSLKYVVTIHDLISFIHPEYFTPKMRMWQHFFIPNAVKISDKIIADSETTKEDILKFFRVEKEKINVIAPWFDEKYKPVHDEQILKEVRQRYSIPDKFILYLGTIEPRKNVVGLVKAYAMLPKFLQQEYTLAIGGGLGWYADRILSEIKHAKTEGNVLLLDYVEHKHLPALYTLANLFVFPSFYEGFGLPPLEAMSCGTPVITSNNSSLPGVVGDAALLVDASSTEEIFQAMMKILTTPSLCTELKAMSLERAKQFNWKIHAEQTLAVFESTIK